MDDEVRIVLGGLYPVRIPFITRPCVDCGENTYFTSRESAGLLESGALPVCPSCGLKRAESAAEEYEVLRLSNG